MDSAKFEQLTQLLSKKYRHILGKSQSDTQSIETMIENIANYYEDIIGFMPGNVYWINNDCTAAGCNKNVLNMLGLKSMNQFKGLTFEGMGKVGKWTPEATQSFKRDTLAVMKTGEAKLGIEEPPIPHSDGRVIYFLTSRVPVFDHAGAVVGVVGISIDISERKKMELDLLQAKDAAETANRVKTAFIANMSHDIRTPLTGIIGMSQMLEEEVKTAEEKDQVHSILECGKNLLDLLNGVLSVVSTDQQLREEDIYEETFDLRESISRLCSLELPMIRSQNLSLKTEIDDALPAKIITDKVKLERIILNLLGNAIKFTQKGHIKLKLKLVSRQKEIMKIKFSVTDTGMGIPKDQQDKVFDQFFRGNPSYKGEFKGYGVGLYIAQKFAILLGGTISLKSRIGKGTTFQFVLPIKINPANKEKQKVFNSISKSLPANKPLLVSTKKSPTVLLIEDNAIAMRIAKNALSKTGCVIKPLVNGESALQLVKTEPIDLILTDIGLPGISGNELTLLIRYWEKISGKKPIPIIGVTAHAKNETEQECLNAGMNAVIAKPFTAAVAQDILNEFILGETKENSSVFVLPKNEIDSFELDDYPLIDKQIALQNIENESALKELLRILVNQSILEGGSILKNAYEKKDWETMQKTAHRLKSGALYCGAKKMEKACQQIECFCKEKHYEELKQAYKKLVSTFNETKKEIETLLQETK